MTDLVPASASTDISAWMVSDDHPQPAALRRIDLKTWAAEFADVYRVSEALAKTPFVPAAMLGKTADVAAAIMKGRELGLDPFDALGSIYVVHGRVGYWADFMRRRIIQAGHRFRVIENTDNRAIVEGTRREDGEKHRATFTAEQAKRAKINLGDYPADKLLARATSRLCRQAFPDVLAGSVIAEDIIDGVIPAEDETVAAAAEPAPTAAIARKRTTRAPKAASTQPPPAAKAAVVDDDLAELLGDDEPPRLPADQRTVPTATAQRQSHDTVPIPPESPDLSGPAAEEPTLDDVEAVDLITPAQLKKLAILLRAAGFDREGSHAFVSTAIDRMIGSSKELTKDEASKIIDVLEDGEDR